VPQHRVFARIEPAIGGRDRFTETDDERRYRAVGMAADAVNHACRTAGLPEFPDAALEVSVHVLAREHGQKLVVIEKIVELPALDLLHPAIGASNQSRHRNDGVEKRVVAKIQISSGDPCRLCAPSVSGFVIPHDDFP
jgi:hypothetical protein